MSNPSLQTAGILFVLIPTVMFGGYSLLRYITKRDLGYLENRVRQDLFRAGHAHAGVIIILSLIALRYVDQADLPDDWKSIVRSSIPISALLMPAGFFLSIAPSSATRPNRLISLVYIGALLLLVGTVTLGVGLLRAS